MRKLFLLLTFAAFLIACSSNTPSNQIKYIIKLPTTADLKQAAAINGVKESEFQEFFKEYKEVMEEFLTEKCETICKYANIDIVSHTFEIKNNLFYGTITSDKDILEVPYHLFNNINAYHWELPSGLTKIERSMFEGNEFLESIIIPEGVKVIEISAFEDCEKLTSVKIPSTLQVIEEGAFANCANLTEIILPEGLIEIGDYAFEECLALTNLKLPSTLKEIGEEAFADCESITSIEIPKGITEIKGGAFIGCTKLAKVKLPSTVEKIGDEAFACCTALKSINTNKVKEIDPSAFDECTNLKLDK